MYTTSSDLNKPAEKSILNTALSCGFKIVLTELAQGNENLSLLHHPESGTLLKVLEEQTESDAGWCFKSATVYFISKKMGLTNNSLRWSGKFQVIDKDRYLVGWSVFKINHGSDFDLFFNELQKFELTYFEIRPEASYDALAVESDYLDDHKHTQGSQWTLLKQRVVSRLNSLPNAAIISSITGIALK